MEVSPIPTGETQSRPEGRDPEIGLVVLPDLQRSGEKIALGVGMVVGALAAGLLNSRVSDCGICWGFRCSSTV